MAREKVNPEDRHPVGTIVKLRSGGPDMTVKSYDAPQSDYTCQWFAGKKLESGFFNHAQLIVVANDNASG